MKEKQLPWLSESKLELVTEENHSNDFATLENKLVVNTLKVGVLYVKPGQTKENEMLSNGKHLLKLFKLFSFCLSFSFILIFTKTLSFFIY
jgi:hypothetical protein